MNMDIFDILVYLSEVSVTLRSILKQHESALTVPILTATYVRLPYEFLSKAMNF